MGDNQLASVLLEIGLPQREVEALVNRYHEMRVDFQQGDYERAGIEVGKFAEGMVKLLQRKVDEELQNETVREFAQRYINGNTGGEVSDRIAYRVPHMMHIAWSIRSNQDAAHLDFENPVRKADAQLGITLCSSMLIELVREFASEDDDLDIDGITALLEELSEPVEENPLQAVVQSRTEFDRQRVADAIKEYVVIVEEGSVERGPKFSELSKKQQLAALGLGRLSAYELDHVDEIGAEKEWYSTRTNKNINERNIKNRDFFLHDEDLGGYYIPGYQATRAISELSDE